MNILLDAIVSECQPDDEELLERPPDRSKVPPTHAGSHNRTAQERQSFDYRRSFRPDDRAGWGLIVEARALNEAIMVASKHPARHLGEHVGWGVEVRPIEEFMQL